MGQRHMTGDRRLRARMRSYGLAVSVRTPSLPPRYRDARPIGRGGMADIYRATDTELGRIVAVKVLADHYAEDADVRARFLREALAAARLSGEPHIVTIYDVGEVEGHPFLVMEYLGGGSLAEALHRGRVAEPQALEWIEQATRALDAAHAHGVVHRDVKPANLLLDGDGNVRVADFGIASAAGLESHTQTGVVLGTAGYLAPEQALGMRATAAADRYSFAVVAHELLTGARPGTNVSTPLPRAAEAVFARALAERPENRFGSCLAFAEALRQALARREMPTRVMRKGRSRALLLIAAALALGTLATVLTVALFIHGESSPPAPAKVIRTVTVPAPAPRTPVAAVQPVTPADHHVRNDRKKHGGKKAKKKKERD
jgi:serine/threonine protein kinase